MPRILVEKLNLSNCAIDHDSLDQMTAAAAAAADTAAAAAASIPGDDGNDSSSYRRLVELNLSRNKVHGRCGGTSLGCFLVVVAEDYTR
jgi:hypothetical protein